MGDFFGRLKRMSPARSTTQREYSDFRKWGGSRPTPLPCSPLWDWAAA